MARGHGKPTSEIVPDEKLETASGSDAERAFLVERLRALQSFFDAIDSLARAVIKLEKLGFVNVEKILGVLK